MDSPSSAASRGSNPTALGGREPQLILLVDDEVDILESLRDLLEASLEGIEVVTAQSGPAALAVMEKRPVNLLITDYKMPGMNGLEFLDSARQLAPTAPRLLITAFPDLDIAIRAINEAGIENFITKPFDPNYVIDVVKSVLAEQRAQALRSQAFARTLDGLRKQLQGPR